MPPAPTGEVDAHANNFDQTLMMPNDERVSKRDGVPNISIVSVRVIKLEECV